uniref:Cyclin-dependent kinases regulatory subunit n=1 Tax=Oncorhynchus mykiss TaxID=8022 RepID=A0A8C7NMI5_ONCMY
HRFRHCYFTICCGKTKVPKFHLISEDEWRRLGVQQSLGWVCHMIHKTEPHILLFRQPLPKH